MAVLINDERKIAMKRILCLCLCLCLLLSLCACGKKGEGPAQPEETEPTPIPEQLIVPSQEEVSATPAPTPDRRPFHTVEITPANWDTYFQLREIPLYSITGGEVISQVCQTYCVVLRDE